MRHVDYHGNWLPEDQFHALAADETYCQLRFSTFSLEEGTAVCSARWNGNPDGQFVVTAAWETSTTFEVLAHDTYADRDMADVRFGVLDGLARRTADGSDPFVEQFRKSLTWIDL